jgi:hypothetical protein
MKKPLLVTVAVLLLWLSWESPVDAYLDPSGGSMLLQILLGGFAAIGVIGRLYWQKLTSVFRRKGPERDTR